jgi:hypothetical protein
MKPAENRGQYGWQERIWSPRTLAPEIVGHFALEAAIQRVQFVQFIWDSIELSLRSNGQGGSQGAGGEPTRVRRRAIRTAIRFGA